MSFKSEAQRRKFQELVRHGKISKEMYVEWDQKTKAELPERVGGKKVKTLREMREEAKKRLK